MTPEQVAALGPAFAAYLRTFEGCFGQERTREHLPTYCRGLLSDLPRKSVEPIALAAGTAVRTLQAFVKDHVWDRRAVRDQLHRGVADALADVPADDLGTVGLRDETSVVNKGKHTPGVQRPYCGAVGKQANCTVTVHLGVVRGGSKTLLDADLFLPQSWSDDRQRCRQAGIPDAGVYQPKGRLGWGQLYRALGNGIALDWLTFDEGYGCRTGFLAELDRLSDLHWVGEVPKSFRCLTARPKGLRPRGWSGKRADDLTRCSAVFHSQTWQRVTLQRQTLGPQQWQVRAAQVYLVRHREVTERTYGLIVARNVATGEVKYFVSNAAPDTPLARVLRVAFTRWNVEHAFRVSKSELGVSHYEGHTYTGLLRHLMLCLVVLGFVAGQADRWRGEKSRGDVGAGVPGVEPTVRGVADEPAGDDRVGAYVGGHRLPPAA